MGRLKYLGIHCLDTPSGMEFGSEHVYRWHIGPRPLPGGGFRYRGRYYPERADLPNERVGGIHVRRLTGRGWSQVGYSDIILLNGKVENLVGYDRDKWVDANEVTNGAIGYNYNSRHIAVVGGKGFNRGSDFNEVLTPEQFISLQAYIRETIFHHPEIQVFGHNQVSIKDCPGFDVSGFLEFINIPERNIYRG